MWEHRGLYPYILHFFNLRRIFCNHVRPWRWWINDDKDNGDTSSGSQDIPGQDNANCTDTVVNGRCDLIDFFPLWIDTQSIQTLDSGNRNRITYRLRQEDGALNYVYTDLTPDTAGDFLTVAAQTYGLFGNEWAHEARPYNVPAAGVILSRGFVDLMHEDPQKGVLLFEGCGATDKPLVIEVFYDDAKIHEHEFPLSIGGVEDMYRFHNFRDPPGLPERLNEPVNLPDSELGDKNMDVFMVHGFPPPQPLCTSASGKMEDWKNVVRVATSNTRTK